ncbi:MAG TPA: NAD(P)H-dependent oxidoreductase [Acidimicrobiales bacterium]|jgi:FMN reductase|nr:NAD(P)H-dependent oxidoreductase [Acidimicrobiales bacterium]
MGILVVGLGGTTRADSSTEKALRASLDAVERSGAETVLFGAVDLDLPMYAPERSARTPNAHRLIEALRASAGVIVASPGYHGTLSGLVKNALDYIEDMREDDPPYLDGRAVGTIACAYGWPATIHTLAALRSVAHALRGWPTPMGAGVNTAENIFGDDGTVIDDKSRFQLELVGRQVVEFAQMRRT